MKQVMTVGDVLNEATATLAIVGIETPRLDAQLLLAKAIGGRREDLARAPERPLSVIERTTFEKSLEQRAKRWPLAYILGECWFYGIKFFVDESVLIPRPETEMLVDYICQTAPRNANVADIGTGSGCIAIGAITVRRDIHVDAVDISENALRVARHNIDLHGLAARIDLTRGDLYAPLQGRIFDIIVSNPPYIADSEINELMPEVREYEPNLALYQNTGHDGLNFYRRLYSEASNILAADGWIAVEVGVHQARKVARIAQQTGYNNIEIRIDGSGIERVVVAQRTTKIIHSK